MISKWKIFICLFTFSFFTFSFTLGSYAKEKESKKDVVAVVNGTDISQTDFDREVGRYEQQMAMMGQTPNPQQLSEIKDKVLNGLIDRELLYQESQKVGLKASKSEVDERISALKQRFPSEEEFKKTIEKLGLNEAGLRSQFEKELAIKALLDKKFAGKVTVTDQEMKKFYDENPDYFKTPERVRASHILVKVEPNASEADKAKARQKIEDIQKKVKKGEDFAALAKQYSDCPSSAKGGDLDYFQRGQMVGPFQDAAFAMKVGDVSDIVETQFGYHLIKVTDKKPAGTVSFEEAKDKIKSYLEQQKMGEEVNQYSAQLKKTAKIQEFVKK
ncbi:MAG: peptidylprolyl isomerase [Desulfoferrobacter sp.]